MSGAGSLLIEGKHAVADMVHGVYRWPGLSPRQVPKAWVQGLKAAGVAARTATFPRGNRWIKLPLVVEYPCPKEHVDESRERFAKVLLLVNPVTGWVSLHEDSCGRCPPAAVESWLITCPRCEAGEEEEHEEHDPLFLPDGDESPLGFVVEAMAAILNGLASEPAEPRPKVKEWDRASGVEWLDNLVKEDGSHVVPPTLGQTAAWNAVRRMVGHPPQAIVREAQAARKRRAMQPPDE